jgi:hypothetical protein
MNSEVMNPILSRRELLIRGRDATILVTGAFVLANCGSPEANIPHKEEVDEFMDKFGYMDRNGLDGSNGVSAAQYSVETNDPDSFLDYADDLRHLNMHELVDEVALAYAGLKLGIGSETVMAQHEDAARFFDGDGITTDMASTVISTGKSIEEIQDVWNEVAGFDGLSSLVGINSTDSVSVITQVAARTGVENAREIYDRINRRYNGDNPLTKATLVMAVMFNDDVSETMRMLDQMNSQNGGLFPAIKEENSAMMILASSLGAYTFDEVRQINQYLDDKTGFEDADRARVILALASIKSGIPMASRKFDRKEGRYSSDDLGSPILLTPIS